MFQAYAGMEPQLQRDSKKKKDDVINWGVFLGILKGQGMVDEEEKDQQVDSINQSPTEDNFGSIP